MTNVDNKITFSNNSTIDTYGNNLYRQAINTLALTFPNDHLVCSGNRLVISAKPVEKTETKTATDEQEKPAVAINDQLEATFNLSLGDLDIKRVIFSDPCTIILWKDGTKTVVRVYEDEKFNPYYGFCAAVVKKMFGSNSKLNKFIDQWIEKNEASKK